jgi:hypothetical protein
MEITVCIPPHLNPLPNGEDFSRTNLRVPSAVIGAEESGAGTRVWRHATHHLPAAEDLSAGVEISGKGVIHLKKKSPRFLPGAYHVVVTPRGGL